MKALATDWNFNWSSKYEIKTIVRSHIAMSKGISYIEPLDIVTSGNISKCMI